MKPEFVGIERRLDRLNECLLKLEPFRERPLEVFLQSPYLQDIVERNLEVAAQCCIDVANRIIVLESAPKPIDYYGSIERLGELGVLSRDFAKHLAPIAGFRNVLVHEYLDIDWNEVYDALQSLDDLQSFLTQVQTWMQRGASLS